MKPLIKARFLLAINTIGTLAGVGLAVVSTVALLVGIESVLSNLIHLLFGVALATVQAVGWGEAYAQVRRLRKVATGGGR